MRAQDEDLGHGDGVEPALDPPPHGAEEHGRADDEDAVERLGVVGRGQRAGGLHVGLEVPELPEADARDVDDVGAQRDGRLVVRPVRQVCAQRLGEAGEVLVQGEQPEQFGRRVPVRLGMAGEGVGRRLLVVGDGLGVEVLDLEQVERDAALVSPAGPLGVLYVFQSEPEPWDAVGPVYTHQFSRLFVGINIYRVVEHVEMVRLSPFFRVAELLVCILYNPSTSTEEATRVNREDNQQLVFLRGFRT